MAEIILPPEENEETPQAPELNIDKPTENSKVITIEFEAKKTNKVSTKDTNQQLYTTDTDAWFEFKETSLEGANGTYSVVFRNLHDGSIFQRTGDVVSGVAYYKIPHQEIRHAGKWRGQLVYTLENGNTTAREFGYDVKGHILDGKDVREIVVEDFETLMSQLRSMKDNAEVELANLTQELKNTADTAEQNETDRQAFFVDLVEDIDELQANYQELLDTGVLQTNINTKLEALEEEYAPKLTEVTAQLAQTEGGLASVQSANAKDTLRIENYLGNFENIHPKVLNFETPWNDFKYWMAYTPYPTGSTVDENPCIAVSNDKVNWTVPTGLINPLFPGDSTDYNNDTHLVYREDIDRIEIWWRKRRAVDNHWLIYRRTSKDGVSWTPAELVIVNSAQDDWMSPAIIFEDGKYKVWYVKYGGVKYIESTDDTATTWSTATNVDIDWMSCGLTPWHLDIIKTDLGVEMVVTAYTEGNNNNSADLYYVVQNNNGVWSKPRMILERNHDERAFDSVGIYRASLIKESGNYHLFYSAIGPGAKRSTALSSGRSIFGLNGMQEHDDKTYDITAGSVTELTNWHTDHYDKFRFMGDSTTEINIIRGRSVGQKITLFLGQTRWNLKLVLKHNPPYLDMPNGKDLILETKEQTRISSAIELICVDQNQWRTIGQIKEEGYKKRHSVLAGEVVSDLDVSDIDYISLASGNITVNSLKGGYEGKVIHFIAVSGSTNAVFVESSRLRVLTSQDYTLTPDKMGLTAICMRPEPHNEWRVF